MDATLHFHQKTAFGYRTIEHGPDNNNINVGHIRIELSTTFCFFIKHRGKVSAKVRQETYRASNLEKGGLEVIITVHCAISIQKAQFLTRLKQLISKRWRDPHDSNDSEHYNKRKSASVITIGT